MNQDFVASAETVETPAVTPVVAATGQQPNAYDLINDMIEKKLVTAIIRKQKIQYSISHFGEFNEDWLIGMVENLAGSIPGDELMVMFGRTTPITLYVGGATQTPFTVQ